MAAGLGFKTFTTGEVLQALDVNGYLMQGILVFATEAARNSAITSPQEGQFAFTKDTNSTWYYDGAAWVASGASGDVTGVTAGTGILVASPTGPVPTVSIDTAVTADLTTAQTLTTKTLTSPVINTPKISSTYSAKTAAYTAVSGDEGNLFSMNNASSIQFNIPTDATFNFAVGTELNVFWITGAGQPTIGAVTPGTTTVISTGATSATPKLRVANSGATCKKLAANSWIVFGDIA